MIPEDKIKSLFLSHTLIRFGGRFVLYSLGRTYQLPPRLLHQFPNFNNKIWKTYSRKHLVKSAMGDYFRHLTSYLKGQHHHQKFVQAAITVKWKYNLVPGREHGSVLAWQYVIVVQEQNWRASSYPIPEI